MRGSVFWIGLAVILGGIVHIAAMLVIPALAPKSGYSRFEAELEPNTAVVRGPAVPGHGVEHAGASVLDRGVGELRGVRELQDADVLCAGG